MAKSEDTDCVKALFREAMNITSLAHYARVQANDAELRARYCMSLAEKAICEAESVHQVSESLTCTSKMVANMTLEYICSLFSDRETENSSDISADEQIMMETLRQMATPEKSDGLFDTTTGRDSRKRSPPKYGVSDKDAERSFMKRPMNKESEFADSSFGILVDNVKLDNSNEHIDKFQEQFPDLMLENKEQNAKDLPKEFDSSHSLPIVYEDSYQGPREKKPTPWTEKKTIRKVQRKLREIDLDGNELDSLTEGSEGFPEIVDGKISLKPPISKETLLKSVTFSDDLLSTSKKGKD